MESPMRQSFRNSSTSTASAPAPVRDVRDYCESMGEDLDDFESDVGANYKLRYEVQEIDTASERKMSTLTLLQSGCFLTD